MRLLIDFDTHELDSFFRKAGSFFRGRTTSVFAKLGERVNRDMQEMVETGGPRRAGVTGTTPGGEANEPVKGWPRTHPRWQQLRGKDDKPLYHTGRFAKSFGYQTIPGEPAVIAGSSDIRSRRFHFGDAALGHGRGNAWSWVAWVDDGGRIADSSQPLGGTTVTMGEGYQLRRFAPVIQPRPWAVVYNATIDDWFREDVGGQLGIHT